MLESLESFDSRDIFSTFSYIIKNNIPIGDPTMRIGYRLSYMLSCEAEYESITITYVYNRNYKIIITENNIVYCPSIYLAKPITEFIKRCMNEKAYYGIDYFN